ncbi:hypothetical protein ACIRQY_31240 [Streptomyces sp. NPDC101490]|uniref:hypothetical protein n=1 Tax=Streptomyces sp. NPDC101490 TaxID=3366143 RepID=UPI003806D02A
MRAAAVFALSAGVITPAVVHAPSAHADWTYLVGTTTDKGGYSVSLPSNAFWVKVSVLASTAPDARVLASTEELKASGNSWTTEAPLVLPEGTPLGDYPVRVDYRLSGETTKQWNGGTYGHRLHLGVGKVSFDHTTTTWDRRTVVLTGTTTSWNPSTGERSTAPEGTTVRVSYTASNTIFDKTAQVGADGSFSLPVTPNGTLWGGTATVLSAPGSFDPDEATRVPGLDVEKLVHRITTNINKFRVLAGTDVRVTGRVERLTDDGWKPFANAPVIATGAEVGGPQDPASQLLGGATSSATGTFTFNARAQYATRAVHTSLRPSAYWADSSGRRPSYSHDIAVPQQFTYSPYTITLDQYGTVNAKGRLNNGSYCDPAYQYVTLQASLDSGRTWRNLRTVRADSYCSYDITNAGYESALYRVHHAETNQLVAKSGPSLKRARNDTRFSAFAISPTRPAVNSKMTVSGTLQQKTGGVWKPFGGAKVTLVFKPKGENQWYWVAKNIPTNGSGRFSYRATAYGDGSWAVYLQTTGSTFYSETKAKYIDAR